MFLFCAQKSQEPICDYYIPPPLTDSLMSFCSCTPLHMSAEHRSKLEVSFLLVEHGARIFENNIHGIRPVDLEPVGFFAILFM